MSRRRRPAADRGPPRGPRPAARKGIGAGRCALTACRVPARARLSSRESQRPAVVPPRALPSSVAARCAAPRQERAMIAAARARARVGLGRGTRALWRRG